MTTGATGAYERSDLTRWVGQGIIGGIVAGIIFAIFEMAVAAMQMGGEALFMPLRMIGGIALGEQALDPSTSLLVAVAAGLVVHMILSAAYGGAIGGVAAAVPLLRSGTLPLVAWASVAGLALWIVNFYAIAPIAGWRWFPEETDPLIQFVAHTFFFGSVLGLYLDRMVRAR
jgi:hypothetical protein